MRGLALGADHKRLSQSRGVVQCGYFADKEEWGFFRCGRKQFLVKNIGFFEIYVSARTRVVEPVRTFFGQGGGNQFFTILLLIVLYGRPFTSRIYKNGMFFSGSSNLKHGCK